MAECSVVLFALLSVVNGNPLSGKSQTDDAPIKDEGFDYGYSNNRYLVIPEDYDRFVRLNARMVRRLMCIFVIGLVFRSLNVSSRMSRVDRPHRRLSIKATPRKIHIFHIRTEKFVYSRNFLFLLVLLLRFVIAIISLIYHFSFLSFLKFLILVLLL